MSDLLKEAIADAKAVRETALANAKMALEEAFTPQLQSMLSAKLREDDDELEDEVPVDDEEEFADEVPGEEVPVDMGDEEGFEDEVPVDMGDEEGLEGLYAQDEVPGEEVPGEEAPVDMGDEEEFEDEPEDELDLEAIIRELESEIHEEDDAYDDAVSPDRDGLAEDDDAYPEDVDGEKKKEHFENIEYEIDASLFEQDDDDEEDDDEDEDMKKEQTDSSNIGSGTGVSVADSSDEEDPGKEKLYKELKEYKAAVRFLKDKLHEVNLLNAKLLFTNKLFKEFALTNDEKMRIVETFDRTQSTREIKLVYTTLAESYKSGSTRRRTRIKESASLKSGSTKPSKQSRKVITEEAQVANRFKKLAGIIK